MDYTQLIKKNLKFIGIPFTVTDGEKKTESFAVIMKNQRKNRLKFESNSSKIGRYFKDYYYYTGPYDVNIKEFSDDAVLSAMGEKFIFVQKEAVVTGGVIQYYTGVLKRIEEDENAFVSGE